MILNDLYVMNEDKMIYKVSFDRDSRDLKWTLENANRVNITLELVYGIDYINPDENDVQGYVGKESFTEDVHYDYTSVYLFDETLKEVLESEGYKILGSLENVNKIVASINRIHELGFM